MSDSNSYVDLGNFLTDCGLTAAILGSDPSSTRFAESSPRLPRSLLDRLGEIER